MTEKSPAGLSLADIRAALARSLEGWGPLNRVLMLPPDITRFHSNAGFITNAYYHMLTERGCQVDILPALGTHEPMTEEQAGRMFGDIPFTRFIPHDWRRDVMKLGEVPGEFLREVSEGIWQEPIAVEINRRVMDPAYDLIISPGQVVPHEVIGMANHAKNLFVGVGGSDMIGKSHMLGALYGMERIMGKDHSPVRKLFDYALAHYLSARPILFALTVTTAPAGAIHTHGLFLGDTRAVLEAAIELSQQKNIDFVERGIPKCVVYLDPSEFRSTWVGNKAVYRTRMAMADGGELVVLAPGVAKFGEDREADAIIRKYGYCGRQKVLSLFNDPAHGDLRANMGVAAHLIHGSADGRFQVTYAVRDISQAEIRGVGFRPADYAETLKRYDPARLRYGWNTLADGEEIFFIPNPALGLWIDRSRF